MPFTIRDILTLKDGRRRVWGYFGSLSTVMGDEKLTSREDLIGLLFFCFTKTTSYASGSEKLLAMYQKSPPKVLY